MNHLEFLVEDASMEAFLKNFLPRFLGADRSFAIHSFQGKTDLLGRLENRLRGYLGWLPSGWRIVVVVDRDNDECKDLKADLERASARAGLLTRTCAGRREWQVVNRLAIEELEAWYFGDWDALCVAYPRVSPSVARSAAFRNPDAIRGTWEAMERVLRRCGYFPTGLRKIELARAMGELIEPRRSRSESFLSFCEALR